MKPTIGHGRCPRPTGFTLAELVIVVLIIGILSAASVPKLMDSMDSFHAEAAAKRIKIDLELARRRARSTSTSQSVQFDSATHGYTIPNLPDPNHPGSDYSVDLTQQPYGAELIAVDFNNTETVTFDGYGMPDNAGTIEVEAGGYLQTLSIEATSGKVTIQ